EMVDGLCEDLKNRIAFEIEQSGPEWLKPKVKSNKILCNTLNVFGKWHEHMWGKDYLKALHTARERMNSIEVDRTRVKPVVKITGEFWAQITEGDGNFHMFEFLEREGSQVIVEPIATWVAYLMYQAKAHAKAKWPVNQPYKNPEWYEFKKQFANYIGLRKKLWGIGAGQKMWNFFYHRTAKQLGGITHELVSQTELADLAHPFYNQFARGEAKVKAKTEFEQCLKSTGKSMAEIREYIDDHAELKRPFYHVPHRDGVAGTAAQFVLHVSDRIDKDTRFWKKSRVRVNEAAPATSGD